MDRQKKNLLVFGYGFALIFAVFGLRGMAKHGWGIVPSVFLLLSVAFLFLTLLRQDWLLVVYHRWMRVGHFISGILTTVILTVLYYGVFGIAGLVRRVLQKDWLETKIDPKAESYWTKREVKPFDKNAYTKQF